MGTNAKILDCCPEPISLLRRTASQEVVFKVDALTALVDESHSGGSSVLALVVSSLHTSLASTLTDAGC